ncbi:hypothetical protein ACWDUL_01710 [Nocardia niigatensis]
MKINWQSTVQTRNSRTTHGRTSRTSDDDTIRSRNRVEQHSRSPVSTALTAAVLECTGHAAAAGICVVWLRGGRVLNYEWCARLDVDVPLAVRGDAEVTVVIAVAPTRLTDPVIGRARVIGEWLAGNGFGVHVVHVRALCDGALWTSLRGSAVAGIVSSGTSSACIASHPLRLSRRSGRVRSRWLMAACAVAATLMCAVPAASKPPNGQPGLISDPPATGQAGLIAPPRPAAPTSNTPMTSTTTSGGVEVLAQPSIPSPDSRALVPGPSPSQPVLGPAAPTQSTRASGEPCSTDIAKPPAEVVRVGAVSLPRPEWMPQPLAAHERQWNDYLTDQAAMALEQSGLQIPGAEQLLAPDGVQAVPQPTELAWSEEVAVEPQTLMPLAAEVADALVNTVAGQSQPDPWQVLAQLPVWGEDSLS